MNAEALALLVRRRIESRYRRLVFVHRELERINVLAKAKLPEGKKADAENAGLVGKTGSEGNGTAAASAPNRAVSPKHAPSESFEDFVFGSIDFSVYKKIDVEEFKLLFDDGLDDYADTFFVKMFAMSREETRNTIRAAYVKVGPFFVCKKSSTILLSIMRTLHTSLDFAPLIGGGEVGGGDNVKAAAGVFDGLVIRHDDGMETKLFSPKAAETIAGKKKSGAAETIAENLPLLRGTFFPLGKACTITLIPDSIIP